MQTANNILLVRVPTQEAVNGRELRDYILESLARGVLVLTEDASCEVMELPPLGGVDVQLPEESEVGLEELGIREVYPESEPPSEVPEPDDKPMNVELHGGRGCKVKKMIQDRLIAYRNEHGLGCWARVAEASMGRLNEDDLRRMYLGDVFPLSAWRIADMTLDALEGKSNDPDRA